MENDLYSQLMADSPQSNQTTTGPPSNSILAESLNHSMLTEVQEEDEKSDSGTDSNSIINDSMNKSMDKSMNKERRNTARR